MNITVVIPTFNSEQTIKRAIDSVLSQSVPVNEIIVVDDGSTDRTIQVIQSAYADTVKIIQLNENAGPGAARNTGIQASSGDWIAFLDADDQWLPDKIKRQGDIINRFPNIKWCCTNYLIDKDNSREPKINLQKCETAMNDQPFFADYFSASRQGVCDIQTSTLMVHKEVFDEMGIFDTSLMRHQDWDLWWRIAHRHKTIGFIAQPQIVHYLLFDNTVVNQRRLEAKKGRWLSEIIQNHIGQAEEAGSIQTFKPLAQQSIRNCLLSMLFIGFKSDARIMLDRFRSLLPKAQYVCFKTVLLTSWISIPAYRFMVWILEKTGFIKMRHRNWDYLKARRQSENRTA